MDKARTEFDGHPLPTDDEVAIIRCVHEGVCPTCGRDAKIIRTEEPVVDNPASFSPSSDWETPMYVPLKDIQPWDDREDITVRCSEGHTATAGPTLHDWWGVRES